MKFPVLPKPVWVYTQSTGFLAVFKDSDNIKMLDMGLQSPLQTFTDTDRLSTFA